MIKVGQVYQEHIIEYGCKYVITNVRPCNNGVVRKYYHAICDDGYVFNKLFETDIEQDKLIAKYPTWQEAVNSTEFRGEK